ncbi:unnamed protein product, partial [Ectocarpus sp. 13 AM-2016]
VLLSRRRISPLTHRPPVCQVYHRAAFPAHQDCVRLLVEQDGTRDRQIKRKMPGISDMLGVWEIKEVKGRPRQAEARELLQKLADQVKPICVAHKWKVVLLLEFIPNNPGLLGLNVNRGQKICIRLRPPSDEGSFYPYEFILGTMLHELVHNQIGPHSANFYRMLDQLNDECDKLIQEGV